MAPAKKQQSTTSRKSLPSTDMSLSESITNSTMTQSKKKSTTSQKKQKTSTPSRSRIEHYMSPGNISKVVGSPIQHQRSSITERRSALDSVSEGERSSGGQRSSGSDDASKKGKRGKKQLQRKKTGGKGDNFVERISSDEKASDDEDSVASDEAPGSNMGLKRSSGGQRSSGSSDEASVSSNEVSGSNMGSKRQRNQRTVAKSSKSNRDDQTDTSQSKSRNSSTLKNATIDKFMSPDHGNSVISTPTRFPRRADNDSSSDEDSHASQSEDEDTARGKSKKESKNAKKQITQTKQSKAGVKLSGNVSQTRTNESRLGRREEAETRGVSSLPSADDMPSTSTGIYHKQTTTSAKAKSKGSKRKSSDSVTTSASKRQRGADKDNISDEDAGTRDEGASINKIKAKSSNMYMASGDIETHMADKEFLASQVFILSKPFIMDARPRQWIQIWKARQSASEDDEEEETEEIPEKVVHKAMSKLNSAMSNEHTKRLSRHQQRKVLMNLDEIRKEEQEDSSETRYKGGKMLRIGASLEEIVEFYPIEWPGADMMEESADKEMADRYGEVRARLFALSCSLTVVEQKQKYLQDLLDQLKDIDRNLKSCTDSDFKKELDRTKSLVSQVLKKLNKRRNPRKQLPSSEEAPSSREKTDKGTDRDFLGGHEALVRRLLASAL